MADELMTLDYMSIFYGAEVPAAPTETFVSLTQAICKLAFGEWFAGPALRYAFEMTRDEQIFEAARRRLVEKTGHFTRIVGEGRVQLKGRLAGGEPVHFGVVAEVAIPIEDLQRFKKFDLALDGLGLGEGVASPAPPDARYRYDPSAEVYHLVRIERAAFLKEFFPDECKRRGRPKGSGNLDEADAPFWKEMESLLANKKASSVEAAAGMVVREHGDKIAGHGTPDSKISRLARGFRREERNSTRNFAL